MKEIWERYKQGIIVAFVVLAAVWALMPDEIAGEADFRAERQKPEYVAYYSCNYSLSEPDSTNKGEGVLRVICDEGYTWADRLFTEDGYIELDTVVEDGYGIYEDLAEDCYVEIDVYGDPLNRDGLELNQEKYELVLQQEELELVSCDYCWRDIPEGCEFYDGGATICPMCVYGSYQTLLSDNVGRCVECSEYYYLEDTHQIGLCYACEDKYGTDCNHCGVFVRVWDENYCGYTLCDVCLDIAFCHEEVKELVADTDTNGIRD